MNNTPKPTKEEIQEIKAVRQWMTANGIIFAKTDTLADLQKILESEKQAGTLESSYYDEIAAQQTAQDGENDDDTTQGQDDGDNGENDKGKADNNEDDAGIDDDIIIQQCDSMTAQNAMVAPVSPESKAAQLRELLGDMADTAIDALNAKYQADLAVFNGTSALQTIKASLPWETIKAYMKTNGVGNIIIKRQLFDTITQKDDTRIKTLKDTYTVTVSIPKVSHVPEGKTSKDNSGEKVIDRWNIPGVGGLSGRGMISKVLTAWIMQNFAMTESEAKKGYQDATHPKHKFIWDKLNTFETEEYKANKKK